MWIGDTKLWVCVVVGVYTAPPPTPTLHDKVEDDGCPKNPHFKVQEEKRKIGKNCLLSKIFVSMNKTNKAFLYKLLHFIVNLTVQFWFY